MEDMVNNGLDRQPVDFISAKVSWFLKKYTGTNKHYMKNVFYVVYVRSSSVLLHKMPILLGKALLFYTYYINIILLRL